MDGINDADDGLVYRDSGPERPDRNDSQFLPTVLPDDDGFETGVWYDGTLLAAPAGCVDYDRFYLLDRSHRGPHLPSWFTTE